jgi:hypothetical protein
MSKVIIYELNGQISVCVPTGEISIEEVLAKDCPTNAIIFDDAELPMGYFDAWELIDGKVVVNEVKKQVIVNKQQTAKDSKKSALAKLTALGLTEDEIKALL